MSHFIQNTSILLILSSLIWIYLFIFWGRKIFSTELPFWTNKIFFRSLSNVRDYSNESIAVIIPARNEQNYIRQTLRSVVKQIGRSSKIILIDDNSNDLTVMKAKALFKQNKILNFKIIKGKELPKGWSGKVWALYQGTEYARTRSYEYFLFIDSDIVLGEKTISSMILKLKNDKLKMISLMARLNCKSIWENILIPPFIYYFKKIYPFNNVNNEKSNYSAAAGGCILCKSDLFIENNLFEKIKNKVIDDCNLAKLIKKEGPIWLGITTDIKSIREYNSLWDIWKMVSRTAYEQLKNSLIFLLLSIFAMFLIYLIAPIYLISFLFDNNFTSTNFTLSVLSTLLMYLSFLPTAKFYNISFSYFIFFPISSFLYLIMTLNSALNYYYSSGNIWKGRKYR